VQELFVPDTKLLTSPSRGARVAAGSGPVGQATGAEHDGLLKHAPRSPREAPALHPGPIAGQLL
jgi:hypothetical protein